ARVLGTGMAVLDAIEAVQVYNAGAPYDNLPLRNMLAGQANVELQNLLAVNSVRAASVVPSGAAPTSVISFTAQSVHPERANASISGSSLHLSNVKAVTTVRVIATDTNGNSVETTVEVAPTPLSAGVAEKAVLGLAARIWGGSATRIVGLPSGLRLNVDTQTLEGFPRRAGTYKSRALVVAGDGSRHWEYFWFTVDALPSWMGGNFDLVMERSEFVGGGLGGAVALRVAASGAASGRLSLPGLNLPFRGLMEKISETEGRLVVDFPANARLPEPLQLEVTVTPDGQAVGRVIGIAGEATLSGWRNTWHATNQPLDGERLGQMNLLMDLASGSWAEANDLVPQGTGWTILRTNRAGRGVMRVKLSDGTPVSGAITVGPGGEIAAWRPLYRNGGSVMLAGGIDEFGKVMGTGTWIRHQSSNLRERRYPEGFGQGIDGPVALEIEGGRWVAPAPGATVLGLPYEASNPEPNASLSWAMGGLADSETAVDDLPLIIDPRNLAKLPAGWANPARVTALLNPAAGLITLRMVIDDENPLFAGKRVRRAVVHQVLLVPPFADG
ncbi:MAG: hypothetical protein KDN20_11460, partial [Verrucomicrobiae bacterium]|nr:hypothetical protein [Verrucomicrobiae bacterium]